jgi:hypothetical protein
MGRVGRRRRWGRPGAAGAGRLLAVLALALAPGSALGAPRSYPDTTLVPSGSIAYTWTATAALGCRAAGLCGSSGTVTIDIVSADFQTGPQGGLNLQTTGTARTDGPAPGTSCIDPLNPNGFGVNLPLARSSTPLVILGQSGPSAGRCAGPLPGDLARLSIPVRRHGRSFDLRRVSSTAAGPFAVTLDSSLVLRPAAGPAGGSASSSGGAGGGSGGPGFRQRLEHLTLIDAVRPTGGALQVGFSAAAFPFCLGLGACGSSGTISLTVSAPAAPLRVEASESVRRALTRAAALRAFEAGQEVAIGQLPLPGTVSETVSTPGQPTCTDSRPVTLLLGLGDPGPATFSLSDPVSSTVRTYCPGPLDSDVLPGQGGLNTIATGTVSRRALLSPQATLSFTRATGFANPAYSGRWSGQLGLTLVRRSLRVSVTGGGR